MPDHDHQLDWQPEAKIEATPITSQKAHKITPVPHIRSCLSYQLRRSYATTPSGV